MKIFRYLSLIVLSIFLAPTICQGQVSGLSDLDTDSDGKVSKEEFLEYAKGKLPDFELLNEFTDRLDADSDGFISEKEYEGRMEALRSLNQGMPNGGGKKKELTKEDLKQIGEATKAYDALTQMASKGDWKEAAKGMTKQASDDYAIGMVTQSLSLLKMKLPPQMEGPAFDEAKGATKDVIDDYKLGDIDISFFLKKRAGGRDQQTEAKARQAKLKTEILAAIDKDDQRWEIVDALRKAQKEASFNRDVLAGKISESDTDDSTVFLTVVQDKPAGQIAIPIVAKMTAQDGKWKYSGIDGPRTQKAMQQMMQRRRGESGAGGGGAPKGPDTDF